MKPKVDSLKRSVILINVQPNSSKSGGGGEEKKKNRNEKGEVTTDTTKKKRIKKDYYQQPYANEMDNLKEMENSSKGTIIQD